MGYRLNIRRAPRSLLARMGRWSAVLAVAASLVMVPAAASFAAGGPASCMGHEASSISPAGTSDEVPGGMRQFTQFVREEFAGVPAGAIYSTIAQLREGSHDACDEALEG